MSLFEIFFFEMRHLLTLYIEKQTIIKACAKIEIALCLPSDSLRLLL